MASSLETWHWVLIALGVCLFVFINAVVIWMIRRRKNKEIASTVNDEERNVPSPTSTTIIAEDIQEDMMTTKDKGDAYGQHFAVVTPAQTALSPPRRERKDSNTNNSNKSLVQSVVEQEHQKKVRSVFSLSPFQEDSNSIQTTPESHFNSNSSSSELSRTFTPFQGHTPTINQMWRGPTPPWTQQHSPRQTPSHSSAS